jgi:hypothetical protein
MKSVQLSAASRRQRVHGRATGGDIAGRSWAREGAYLFSPETAAVFAPAGRSGSWTGLPGQTDVGAVARQGEHGCVDASDRFEAEVDGCASSRRNLPKRCLGAAAPAQKVSGARTD